MEYKLKILKLFNNIFFMKKGLMIILIGLLTVSTAVAVSTKREKSEMISNPNGSCSYSTSTLGGSLTTTVTYNLLENSGTVSVCDESTGKTRTYSATYSQARGLCDNPQQ